MPKVITEEELDKEYDDLFEEEPSPEQPTEQ